MPQYEIDLTSREDRSSFAIEVTEPNETAAREYVEAVYPYCRIDRLEPLGSRAQRFWNKHLGEQREL